VPLGDLGTPVSPAALVPLLLPLPGVRPDGALQGQVLWVDHFGNAQLNVSPEELTELGVREGDEVSVLLEDESERDLRFVPAFGAADEGEVVLVVDSYGLVAVARNRGRAADVLPLGPGAAITLRPTPRVTR
jgi:S-adenosylmethionine hydrolase